MNTSYSSLDTFLSCPLKYKFKEIDRIKTPKSSALSFGSLIHKTLKFIHESDNDFPSKEEAINFFSENWNPAVFKEEEAGNLFENGIGLISNYLKKIEQMEKKQLGTVIALEKRFILPFGKHTISGSIDRIDRVGNSFKIIDYKTNRKIATENEVKNNLQLSIYLKAFTQEWPSFFKNKKEIEKVELALYFVRHNLEVSVRKNLKEMELLEEEILKTIDEIEERTKKNSFEPRMGPLCDWCDYKRNCPLFSHQFRSLDNEEEEIEVKDLSLKYIDLKEQKSSIEKEMKILAKQLENYMEQSKLAQFFTEKGSVARVLRETYRYNPKLVIDSLKDWGVDPATVVKVEAGKLKQVASKLEAEKRKELESFKELERQSYSLTVRKNKKLKN